MHTFLIVYRRKSPKVQKELKINRYIEITLGLLLSEDVELQQVPDHIILSASETDRHSTKMDITLSCLIQLKHVIYH